MIWTYLLMFLATVFMDIMDTVDFHTKSMIFPRTKYFRISTTGYRWIGKDAWHDSKKAAQLCFSLAGWFAYTNAGNLSIGNILFHVVITMVIYYLTHKLFFGYLFIRPEYRS